MAEGSTDGRERKSIIDTKALAATLRARYRPAAKMKTLSLSFFAVAAFIFASSIDAKTIKLPNDEFAFAQITIPDSWEPSEVNNGVEANSPDKAVYISAVGVGSEKGMDSEIEDTFKMLKDHNVDLDQSSKKEQKFEINGVEANELIFKAKDEDGPCTVSITFVPIKNKVVVVTYWVTTSEEEKNSAAVGKIANSIKAAE